ncbi:MAG: YceI family protein [Anaeromyxobacter sp.]|nr:YceI family protein [Anaeromyxobacter sp.]
MTTFALALALLTGTSFTVDPGASTARYRIVHKLHEVTATSARLEGKAVLQPEGRVITQLRVPVASFDSGDRNRDVHMQEVLESAAFPFVVFKGAGALPAGPPGAPVQLRLAGELEFHGVKRPLDVALEVELRPDGTARARGAFEVSLEAHRVERPSLLFVKVEDACRVEFDLLLRGDGSAPTAPPRSLQEGAPVH